jgi:uncharacterized protein
MAILPVIDTDTHVDETESTWDYLSPDEQALKPTTGFLPSANPSSPPTRYWDLDGNRRLRPVRDDAKSGTALESRELLDVDVRLRHMDDLGVEVHVIYPTLFGLGPAPRPEVELALTRSYNRWLAARCARSHGRLRWVCVPPLRDIEAALHELRFAKDNGACGVLKKGDQEAERWPPDPYFYPFYAEAERLDLPICFHTGSGIPDFPTFKEFSYGIFMRNALPVVHAVHALIVHDIPKKYPKLRFGCIEAGVSWIPYVVNDLRRRAEKRGISARMGEQTYDASGDIFKENRIYVTAQVDEDLPYVMQYISEDNLLIGSDYTHQDSSREAGYLPALQARAERGEISFELIRKMTYDNANAFYGL